MGSASSTSGQSIAVRPVQSATINDKSLQLTVSTDTVIPTKQPDKLQNHTADLVNVTQKKSIEKEEKEMNSSKAEIKEDDNSSPTDPTTEDKTVNKNPNNDQEQAQRSAQTVDDPKNEEQEENNETPSQTELTEEDIEALKTKAFKTAEKNLAILSDMEGHLKENGLFNQDFKKASFTLQNTHFALKRAKFEVSEKFKQELGDVFVELGGVKTICDVVVFCQRQGYYSAENKLKQGIWIPLLNCTIVLINFTDVNPKYAHLLVENGEFLSMVCESLQTLQLSHLENNMREKDEKLLGCFLSIIHNLAQAETIISELRDWGFVEVHLPFLKSNKDKVLLTSLATLADLVDESQAKHLETDGEVFTFLLKCLKSASKDKHRRCKGWSVRELARTIRRISKNDVNKKGLVAQGCLPVLVPLADSIHEDEQIEVLGALWMLSFDKDNQDVMLQDASVMETFLKHRTSQNKKINNSCNGALWNMREKLSSVNKYKELGKEYRRDEQEKLASAEGQSGHVMISYQWADQPLIKRIRDSLQENGVKCWMDIDDMQGSTLNAMARAVERAEIVLICYSKKYYDSPNCRAEAEYAFQLRKPIIPLKMERNYQAREWLGFIIGSKLFFEFTDKYPFESKMSGLIKEILTRQKKSVPNTPVISHAAPVSSEKKETSSSKPKVRTQASEVVKNWKENDVLRWIHHHKLPSSKFSSLTGIEIAFLQVLRQESPDFFYKTLNDMLKIKDLPTLAKFTFALEDTLV